MLERKKRDFKELIDIYIYLSIICAEQEDERKLRAEVKGNSGAAS